MLTEQVKASADIEQVLPTHQMRSPEVGQGQSLRLGVSSRPSKITRPSLNYMGGKFKIRRWIQQYFPPHSAFLSPFGGGASEFLGKPVADLEIYADVHPRACNYFYVLAHYPELLIRSINGTEATSDGMNAYWHECDSMFEDAHRFYVYSLLSFGGGGSRWSSGCMTGKYLKERFPTGKICANHLWANHDRMKNVKICLQDAFEAIARVDSDTLIYADPPYLNSTRGGKDDRHADRAKSKTRGQYQHELTDEQHDDLLEKLKHHLGPVVISSYPSEQYAGRLHNWYCVERQVTDRARNKKTECLWVNSIAYESLPYQVQETLKPTSEQLLIFTAPETDKTPAIDHQLQVLKQSYLDEMVALRSKSVAPTGISISSDTKARKRGGSVTYYKLSGNLPKGLSPSLGKQTDPRLKDWRDRISRRNQLQELERQLTILTQLIDRRKIDE